MCVCVCVSLCVCLCVCLLGPPPPQDPSPLRGTLGSSLRSPAEGEGHEGFPPPPDKNQGRPCTSPPKGQPLNEYPLISPHQPALPMAYLGVAGA